MRQALFIAAFDSQLKWCARIRDELATRGFATSVVVPDVRSALSPGQVRDAGFEEVVPVAWPELVERALRSDVVVCSLSGPLARQFSFALAERLPEQSAPSDPALRQAQGTSPVVVTGWVGVIIERIVAGYLDRCGTDVVAVNAAGDFDLFTRTARRLELPADNLLLAGLPFLSPAPAPQRSGPVRRVLFADQPTVPTSEQERRYVYRRLLAYAAAHPDREVLLKPRHRPGEDTFHRMRHHPEDLLAGEPLPANFRVDYTPIKEALPDTDLLLTVSSTACLEALDAGCRVGLVLDLGVHERYGNHVLLESGLLRTFDELERDELGTPDPDWLAGYFLHRERSATEQIADRVQELLATGHRPSRAVWESAYFRGVSEAQRALLPASAPSYASAPLGSRPRPYGRQALLRRQRRWGPVRGTVVHVSSALVPPILNQPLRRVSRRTGLL